MGFASRISHAYIWNHFNKSVGYFLDFCLSIVLARGLGSYGYGVYSELYNFVFLFSLFCSIGIDTAVNVYIPKYIEYSDKLSALLRKVFLLFGTFSIVVCSFVIIARTHLSFIINSPDIKKILTIAAFYIFFHNFLTIAQAIITSFYETKFLLYANTTLKFLYIIFSLILLEFKLGLLEIIYAFTIVNIVISTGYFLKIWSTIRPKPTKIDFLSFIKFGFNAWIIKFLNYFLGRYFDIFILGVYGISKDQISYYNIAFSITLALSFVFTSGFSGVSLTAFSELANKNDRVGIAQGWFIITKFVIFFCVPVFIFVLFYSKQIIILLYSYAFVESANLLRIFGIWFLLSLLIGSGVNVTVLFALKKDKLILYLRFLFGIFNVVLDVILVPKYGATGAIIATGISTFFIILVEFLFAKKYTNFDYPLIYLMKILVASVLALAFLASFAIVTFLHLILISFGFGILFLTIIYFIKPFTLDDMILAQKINPLFARIITIFSK